MTVENIGSRERVVALEKQLDLLERQKELSDEASVKLSEKLKTLENKKKNYTQGIKELDKNVKTKDLLDTRLPDDLRRLLNDAINSEGISSGEHP